MAQGTICKGIISKHIYSFSKLSSREGGRFTRCLWIANDRSGWPPSSSYLAVNTHTRARGPTATASSSNARRAFRACCPNSSNFRPNIPSSSLKILRLSWMGIASCICYATGSAFCLQAGRRSKMQKKREIMHIQLCRSAYDYSS